MADVQPKRPSCKHQYHDEPNCVPAVRNSYHCDKCDVSWDDDWSCGCDDECPNCGADISPDDSVEIAPCACEAL